MSHAIWTIGGGLSFREIRDDRVLVFIDNLYAGPASFDYLARATTAGTFVVPGTTAEEMYQPEIARTGPGDVRGAGVADARRRQLPQVPALRAHPTAIALAAAIVAPPLAWWVAVHVGTFPRERLEPRRAASLTVLDAQGNVLRQDATSRRRPRELGRRSTRSRRTCATRRSPARIAGSGSTRASIPSASSGPPRST